MLSEVDLKVPAAISWLPKAVQEILGSKTTLGQAIVAAARQATQGEGFGDQHLVKLADLNNAVRMRSSSPRFDLFSDTSRQRSPLPPSRPKPILEPPVTTSAAPTRHYAIHTPGITTPVSEEAGGAATPAPADFHIGNAADLRVPSTGTLRSKGEASSIASTVLRKRAEVARKRAEAAALQLAAEEAELLALEASSQASRSVRREVTPGPNESLNDNSP